MFFLFLRGLVRSKAGTLVCSLCRSVLEVVLDGGSDVVVWMRKKAHGNHTSVERY